MNFLYNMILLVPYPDALCALHFHENLAAVLCKLSSEIGVELDHIEPREVLKGDRRSVANLLELITAFIAHCVDENLLDFADVDYASTNSPKFAEGCAGLGDVNLTSHLCTSPELPRCVGRSCVPSSPLQHSHDSPPSAAPSLKSSPVSSKPLLDEPQVDKLDTPALAAGLTDPKQCTITTTNHVRESIDDGHATPALPAEGTCIAVAPQLTPLHDHRHRKVSSSSSGRGHSPTHTLTAPGATSATSVPQSLSESPRDPDQRSLNEHVLNCTLKSDTHLRPRRKLTHSRRRHIDRRGAVSWNTQFYGDRQHPCVDMSRTTRQPVRKPESDSIHDSEFERLMELKHRLMLDALKMYRSEMNVRQMSSDLPSEFRCPRCHFVA
ncbi:hypothetical protein AHF37_04097 [Paragonimus kellicotti]|nr:hypothetical protein AHF37_04097 [Paragonimus kellicotti]